MRNNVTQPERPSLPRILAYVAGAVVVLALIVFGALAIFGGGDGDVVNASGLENEAEGTVVYCSGLDVSRSQRRSVEDFNDSSASETSKARLVDNFASSETAEGQRLEYLERIDKGECDVVYLDVIYTSEFASKGKLRDMTSYVEGLGGADVFDERMLRSASYEDKLWGVPKHLDGGLIFYRKDREEPPASWPQVLDRAVPEPGERPGLRFQLDAYEGLTVVFLELAYAAGAELIVSEDGKKANLNQPETLTALKFLRDAIRRRAAPKAVLRQGDAGSFYAFSVGRATFLRSWPFAQSRFQVEARDAEVRGSSTSSTRLKTAANRGVVALPPWRPGGRRVGILGGHNLVIPRTAKNPTGALHLVDFLVSEEQILRDAAMASLAPVLPGLRNNPDVRRNPALAAVNDLELELRPMLTNYAQVSKEIYETLRRVLSGQPSDETLAEELVILQKKVQAKLG